MKPAVIQRIKKRRSELGRARANARWAKDRERRAALAARDPDRSRPIACRIIVIYDEVDSRETTIYHDDSPALARRKKREAFIRHHPPP